MESLKKYISDKTVGGFIYVLSMSQKTWSDRSGAKGFINILKGVYKKLILL